jgi:hypothetical protein
MKKVTLVIAAYNKDLSWLDSINNDDLDIVIINKGIHINHEKARCITIKNVGVCDNSFLYYISEFYDTLSEFTIFCQDNPFDHYKNMIHFINNREYEKGFKSLSDMGIYIPPKEGTDVFVEGILDFTFNGVIFPSGAQYCVTKNNIHCRTKEFWSNLFKYLPWDEDSFVPYFLERIWIFLYDPNIKTNKNYLQAKYLYKFNLEK